MKGAFNRVVTLSISGLLLIGAAAVVLMATSRGGVMRKQSPSVATAPLLVGGEFASNGGITLEEDARLVSGPPGNVSVAKSGDLLVVRWIGTRVEIVVAYRVYRRCMQGQWQQVAQIPTRPRNEGQYEVFDKVTANCEYAVSSIDHYGNEGPKSEPVQRGLQ